MAKNKNNNQLGFDFGRQMFLDQRNKTLVCFSNRLKIAKTEDYNEIHGKYSIIQLLMEDYSKGKGSNAVFVYYNLEPRDVRTICHWVSSIYPTHTTKEHNFKLYKSLNGNYWQIDLVHNPKMKNPFGIIISNGNADRNLKPVNKTGEVKQWYSYEMFYSMWQEIYDKLKYWEFLHYSQLCRRMEPVTQAALDKYYDERKNSQNKGNKQNGNNGNYANYAEMPPLAPPPVPNEQDIPFEEMPNYGTAYRR